MIRIIPLLLISSCFIARGQIAFEENGKFGFKSAQIVIIEPQYDYASDFIEGLACVKVNEKWGFINTNNEWVSKKYDKIQPLKNGIAKVMLNGKFGLINRTGYEIIAPEYDKIEIVTSTFFILIKNGLFGLLSNNLKIPCSYMAVGQRHDSFAYGKKEDGTFDIYNENGLILENQVDFISKQSLNADNNFIAVSNEKYGLFNVFTNKWSISPKYAYITTLKVNVDTRNEIFELYAFFKENNEENNASLKYYTTQVNEIEIRSMTYNKIKIKHVTGYLMDDYKLDYSIYFNNNEDSQMLSQLISDILGI